MKMRLEKEEGKMLIEHLAKMTSDDTEAFKKNM